MQDLNSRIRQLTKLIVTSQTVDQSVEQSRPVTPAKVDFDMSPYQVRFGLFISSGHEGVLNGLL